MAYSKAQLEALAASLLASNQPIAAVQHRSQVQTLIDEMFSSQSRGNVLAGVQSTAAQEANDTALIIRNGQAFRLPLSVFSGSTLAGLGDVFIQNPGTGNIEALVYDPINTRWVNSSLDGLFATQDELNNVLASVSNKVSYNVADNRSSSEKNQARTNIGSTSATPQVIATAGAIDNLAITSNHLVFTGADVVLSGIVAGLDGEEVTILNTNATALSILSQSTLSDAGNRIIGSLLVPQFSVVRLKYRTTTNRWVIEALGVNDGRYVRKDVADTKTGNLTIIAGNLSPQASNGGRLDWVTSAVSGNGDGAIRFGENGVEAFRIGRDNFTGAGFSTPQFSRPVYFYDNTEWRNGGLFGTNTAKLTVSTGRLFHAKSGASNESTRRDELYLNYSQTVTDGGTINDLAINADTKLLVLTNALILTGVVGEEGRLLRVRNGGVSNIIISNNDTSSLAANRFQLDNSFVLPFGRVATFIYSGGGWRLADVGAGYVTLATDQTITGTKIFASSTLRTSASGTSAVTIYRNTSGSSISSSDANNFGFNNSNNIYFSKSGSNNIGIFAFNNTAERTYTLPDASGNIVLGTGTTNFIPKFTGASTLGNSLIFDNGTNVLIGTTSELTGGGRLQVNGRITAVGGGSNGIIVEANSGSVSIDTNCLSFNTGFNVGYIQNFKGGVYVDLFYGASNHFFDGGNVLINTSTPLTGGGRLQVNGRLNVNGTVRLDLSQIPTSDPISEGEIYRDSLGRLFISTGIS